MKKLLLSAVSLAAMTGSALAADLPSRKAPVIAPPPPPMWTGFYAGLNAGYGWGTNAGTNSSLWSTGSGGTSIVGYDYGSASFVGGALGNTRQSMTQSGFVGGAQFGYNYQYGQNFLIGFETDIQGTGMRGGSTANGVFGGAGSGVGSVSGIPSPGTYVSANQTGYGATAVSAGIDYLGTVRGRIGYLFTPTLLIYGTGGLAYGGAWANVATSGVSNTEVTSTFTGGLTPPAVGQTWAGGGRANALLVGYSAGGGLEWMFMPNWSLKGEALYYNLGNMNVTTSAFAAPAYGQTLLTSYQSYAGSGVIGGHTSVNYQGVIARAGVNYHFNFGAAPVVAKF